MRIAKTSIAAALWLLIVIKLWVILSNFHFVVTDNDQALLWWACHDIGQLKFYTPFLYGCSYGNMLEAYLALPFYKAGLPVYQALPISNAFWLVVLFGGLTFRLFKEKKEYLASFSLLALLFIPAEGWVIILAPKAHMTGIYLMLLAILLSIGKTSRNKTILIGILCGLGIAFNPNSIILAPIVPFILSDIKKWIPLTVAAILSFIVYSSVLQLYTLSPGEVLHNQWSARFSLNTLFSNLSDTDKYLSSVTPFFSNMGFLSFVFPVVLLAGSYKELTLGQKLILVIFPIALILSFGVNKTLDGTSDVLFHYSRFYLAMVFVNAACIGGVVSRFLKVSKVTIALLTLIVLSSAYLGFTGLKPNLHHLVDNAGKNTDAARKIEIETMLDQAMQITRSNKPKSEQNIIVTDFPYYTTAIYLRSQGYTNVYFSNVKQFYWLNAEAKSFKNFGATFYLGFEDNAQRCNEKYPNTFRISTIPFYYVVRVDNWKEGVEPIFD